MSTESEFKVWLESDETQSVMGGLLAAAFAAGAASEREWIIRILESSGAMSLNGVRNLAIMLRQKKGNE